MGLICDFSFRLVFFNFVLIFCCGVVLEIGLGGKFCV